MHTARNDEARCRFRVRGFMSDRVIRKVLMWLENVERRSNEWIIRRAYLLEMEGKRDRGRFCFKCEGRVRKRVQCEVAQVRVTKT